MLAGVNPRLAYVSKWLKDGSVASIIVQQPEHFYQLPHILTYLSKTTVSPGTLVAGMFHFQQLTEFLLFDAPGI